MRCFFRRIHVEVYHKTVISFFLHLLYMSVEVKLQGHLWHVMIGGHFFTTLSKRVVKKCEYSKRKILQLLATNKHEDTNTSHHSVETPSHRCLCFVEMLEIFQLLIVFQDVLITEAFYSCPRSNSGIICDYSSTRWQLLNHWVVTLSIQAAFRAA